MKKLTSNYIFVLLYNLITIITPLFTTPYVSRVLGPNNIGVDAYVNSIVQIFLVFILLNIGVYGRKQIASARTKELLHEEFCSIYSVQFMTTIIVMFFYFLYVNQVSNFQDIFLLYGITLLATGLDIAWYFIGLEKVKQIMIRNILVRLLSIISIFLFVKNKDDLWIFVLINSAALFAGQVVTWGSIFKELKQIRLTFKGIKKHIGPILTLSIVPCVSMLYLSINKVFLGKMADSVDVGFYNQAYKLIIICLGFINALSTVIMPKMVQHYSNGEEAEYRKLITFSVNYLFFTTLPLTVLLILLANLLVPIFLGTAFTPASNILITLAPVLILTGLTDIFGVQILLIRERNRAYAISVIFGAIIGVGVNALLLPHLKSIGTAVAHVISILASLLLQMYSSRDVLEFRNLVGSLLKYLLFSIIMGLFVVFVGKLIIRQGAVQLLIVEVITAIIIYAGLLFISKDRILYQILNRKERKYLWLKK
ncbi:oligosaccharide flippase family protein [Bacillus cereus group sp. BfR-BA-01354]|uniref:oligosaccharide flippase family protein n=1 Tax=Bacillus cereus group TaxID=86661 RepID=UPI001F595387